MRYGQSFLRTQAAVTGGRNDGDRREPPELPVFYSSAPSINHQSVLCKPQVISQVFLTGHRQKTPSDGVSSNSGVGALRASSSTRLLLFWSPGATRRFDQSSPAPPLPLPSRRPHAQPKSDVEVNGGVTGQARPSLPLPNHACRSPGQSETGAEWRRRGTASPAPGSIPALDQQQDRHTTWDLTRREGPS